MKNMTKKEHRERIVAVLRATKFNYWHPEIKRLRHTYLKKFNEHFTLRDMKEAKYSKRRKA